MGDGNEDAPKRLVRCILSGNRHQVRRACGVLAENDFKGAVGFFGLVKKFGLGGASLKCCEDGPDVRERPFHDDLALPVELLFAALRGGFDEHAGFFAVEAEANDRAVATRIRLINGIGKRAVGPRLGRVFIPLRLALNPLRLLVRWVAAWLWVGRMGFCCSGRHAILRRIWSLVVAKIIVAILVLSRHILSGGRQPR